MAHNGQDSGARSLSGQTVVGELLRNMELGRFELSYSVLLPCVFHVYLHPDDHARLQGVFPLIGEDARRALRTRVAELNNKRGLLGIRRTGKQQKEFKIACKEWTIEFLSNSEVPLSDVEIHSELNETVEPGFRGMKTTLIEREPSVFDNRTTGTAGTHAETRKSGDQIFAEILYEDDSGPQLYLVTQNEISVGRGGDSQMMDLALYAPDDISREHLRLHRDPATGTFTLTDKSTNGTWLNGRRLRKGDQELLPDSSVISLAEVLTLSFRLRK